MLAHIRYATQGEVSLENVHPFSRVWKGVQITFCHNGDCPHFGSRNNKRTDRDDTTMQGATSEHDNHNTPLPLLGQTTPADVSYHPVGDTDSEAVFCAILNALTVEFPNGLPTLPVLHEFLSVLCNEIIAEHPESTIFNFLLGCGQHTLFAYSWPGKRPGSDVWNGLYYIIREPPFSTAKLLDTDYEIDFRRVTTPADRVAVITTKPLTEEPGWIEFQRNSLIMFNRGVAYRTPECCEVVEQQGCGLYSKVVTKKCGQRSPKWGSRSTSRCRALSKDSCDMMNVQSNGDSRCVDFSSSSSEKLSLREFPQTQQSCISTDGIIAAKVTQQCSDPVESTIEVLTSSHNLATSGSLFAVARKAINDSESDGLEKTLTPLVL
jgi:predicted glutamine amidotransferase